MDPLEWLDGDKARNELKRLVPEMHLAAEKALVTTESMLVQVAEPQRRQLFADALRANLAQEFEAMFKQPEVTIVSAVRNGVVMYVDDTKQVSVRLAKAVGRDGSPNAGRQSESRRHEYSLTDALFSLSEIGFEVSGPVTLMCTWRVDAQGIHLYLTLPKSARTRYDHTAYWCLPLDFPAIPVSSSIAFLVQDEPIEDEDDDLGYGRREERAADGDDDGDGDDAA